MISHQSFMNIAYELSNNSYCKRKKVGCIIVKDSNIISIGYNGTISGFNNCCEENNKTKKEVLHAETNAISKCSKSSYSSNGATMYCTLSPCFECSKLIIQSGIAEVYYNETYRKTDGIDLLKKAGVKTIKI